jgi:OFA family oxalate/formate antiporter-like MFS transporter
VSAAVIPDQLAKRRWWILVANVVAMVAIANLQYGWTQFTTPLTQSLKQTLPVIQVTFTLFVVAQTWPQFLYGWLLEKFGTRLVVSVGALFVAWAWIGSGLAKGLPMLYTSYTIGGVGAGIVYGACVSMGTKWFPDRRGLAVGITAGAYGFGSAFTVIPIANMITGSGIGPTFITFGIIQGVLVLLMAQFMRFPAVGWKPAGWVPNANSAVKMSTREYTPKEMLSTKTFYVLYLMMTMLAFGGMMMTAQMKPLAHTFGHDKLIVFGSVTFLSMALINEQIANGFTRPFWGWISDYIGRYNTMAIAFTIESTGLVLLSIFIKNPYAFMFLSALTYFAWGEIYSLFPSAITDVYGSKNSAKNYGILYTSKGVATIAAAPGAAWLMTTTGSWTPVLLTAAAFDITAAALALFWLKPMVTKQLAAQKSAESGKAAV